MQYCLVTQMLAALPRILFCQDSVPFAEIQESHAEDTVRSSVAEYKIWQIQVDSLSIAVFLAETQYIPQNRHSAVCIGTAQKRIHSNFLI